MTCNLGHTIRHYRKDRKLTLKLLGEKVGYAENSVWQWENNKREPNIETLLNLAKTFDISIIELLGGTKMENGNYEFNGKEYSLYDEMKKYDKELPNWCEEKGYVYEHSTGRELLFIPIENTEWGKERPGILLEVPEHAHFESAEQYKENPLVFFSLGNFEDGYHVEANIDLSVYALEETIRKFNLLPIHK